MNEITTDEIESNRITYTDVGHGVRVEGQPFVVEFESPIDMPGFYTSIVSHREPWQMFAVRNELDDDYWRLSAVLIHVEDGETHGASKVDMELCPEWLRVYVKEDADAERVKSFVDELCRRYNCQVKVP